MRTRPSALLNYSGVTLPNGAASCQVPGRVCGPAASTKPLAVMSVSAMALAAIGTIAFSIAPALRVWRQDALPWLKAGEHSVAQGRSRLSGALVVLQLAFSVVLLTIAGVGFSVIGPKLLRNATNIIFEGVTGKQLPAGPTKDKVVAALRALQLGLKLSLG